MIELLRLLIWTRDPRTVGHKNLKNGPRRSRTSENFSGVLIPDMDCFYVQCHLVWFSI